MTIHATPLASAQNPAIRDVRDFASIQNAIDGLGANGGEVMLPGSRTLTASLTWTGKQYVHLAGSAGSELLHNAGSNPLVLIPRTSYGATLRNLRLAKPGGGTSTGHGVVVQGDAGGSSAFHLLEQLWIEGLGGDGIRCEQGNHVTAVRCYCVSNAGAGLRLATGASQPSNVDCFLGCAFRVNAVGVAIDFVQDAYFYAPVVESNTGWGMTIAVGSVYVRVVGGHFENNGTGGGGAGHLSLDGSYCTFTGCYFSTGKPISITGDRNAFVNCAMGNQVTIVSTADGTVFDNCDFAALPTDNGSTNTVYRHCTVNGAAMFSESRGLWRAYGFPGDPASGPTTAAVAINPSTFNFANGRSLWVGAAGVEHFGVNAQNGNLELKGGANVYTRTSSPEGALDAPKGSLCIDYTNAVVYQKGTASGSSIGWVALATAGSVTTLLPSFPGWLAGAYYGTASHLPSNTGSGTLTAGGIYAFPVFIPDAETIDRLGAEITTLSAGKHFRVAVYDATGARRTPHTLIVDSGDLSAGATGWVEATGLSAAIPQGMAWYAITAEDNVMAFRVLAQAARASLVGSVAGGTPSYGGVFVAGTYGAFPSTFAAVTNASIVQQLVVIAARAT